MGKLTENQEKFVHELIKGKSQREAYREAYPKSNKWKDNVVDVKASELFKIGKVLVRYNEIHDRLIKEAEDECIVDAKKVLNELAYIAFADVKEFAKVVTVPKTRKVWNDNTEEYDFYEVSNQNEQIVLITDTDKLNKNKTAVIKSIKQGRHGVEIELYPKDKALELLGKHLGIFKDRVEISGQLNNPMEGLTTEELKKLIYDE